MAAQNGERPCDLPSSPCGTLWVRRARLRTLQHKLVELGIRAAGQETVQLHQKPHVQVLADRGLAPALLRRLTATSLDIDTHLLPERRQDQAGGQLRLVQRQHGREDTAAV